VLFIHEVMECCVIHMSIIHKRDQRIRQNYSEE
jgi:hypothetical protein